MNRSLGSHPFKLGLGFSALVSACVGAPNPLAPQLSGSVGLPHDGVQTDAVELPRSGLGFTRYRPNGRAYWAQPALIEAVKEVAREGAARFGSEAPLVLGDFSGRHGGKIPRHNSHRTGRDVDLLWHLRTLDGRPVKSPGFLQVGPDGLAYDPATRRIYQLDVERQWFTVKAFLQSPHVDVQWMFCSRWVEALLIEYARARGEPDELVWRAQNVMLQPADSLPHDDHIHLRVACSPTETLSGCAGGGPYWEWLPELPQLHAMSEHDLLEIGQQDPLIVDREDGIAPQDVANHSHEDETSG